MWKPGWKKNRFIIARNYKLSDWEFKVGEYANRGDSSVFVKVVFFILVKKKFVNADCTEDSF